VGDAPGQDTQTLHLLSVFHLLFQFLLHFFRRFALGNISNQGQKLGLAIFGFQIGHHCRIYFHQHFLPVARHHLSFK